MEYLCFQHPDATHTCMMRSLHELWHRFDDQLQEPDLSKHQIEYLQVRMWMLEREAEFVKSVH